MSADRAQLGPYETIDFEALSQKDEEFREIWMKSSGRLDFQDPETCRVLSKAILQTDFDLQIEVPDDRLCPPIPNRWNYVAWIHALIDSTNPDFSCRYDPARKVAGLDIGTGASAIYTLLLLQSRPNWSMCVTDVDKKSFDSAARNLAINNMLTRIKMLQTTDLYPLIPMTYLGIDKLDFTICNPPFFTDENEMRNSTKGLSKSQMPNAICTGSESEMVCAGGDLGFVTRIVNESLSLREKVTWYSSMLGKLDSAKAIINLLKQHGITNWAVGYLEPGRKTKRWVVAWSFGDYRPSTSVARLDTMPNEFLPFPTQYKIDLSGYDISEAKEIINAQLSPLHLHWQWDPDTSSGIGEAPQNVWNRAYRREQQRKEKSGETAMEQDEDNIIAFAFRLRVIDELSKEIIIDWLRGTDVQLWESFRGLVHRNFKKS
jgi:23S rRNA (adenine1618-N6)-methyltransferase